MYKSFLLYLLSTTRPYLDAEKEQGSDKTPAQVEREKIKVESFKKADDAKSEEKTDNDNTGNEGSEEGDTEGEDNSEDGETEGAEGEEEGKEKELSAEDLKAENDKLKKTIARLQKRTGRTEGEKKEIARQLAEAKASLAANVEEGKGLSEEEVERRANAKAEEKMAEREFTRAVNNLNKEAKKVDAEFPTKIKELTEDVAPVPGHMIGILEDLDNGGAVLAHLAANPEVYEDLYELPITRMATQLSKLSAKLIDEADKKKKKPISQTPAPLNGVRGNNKSPSQLPSNPTQNMKDYVQQRNIQIAERRKARGY